MRRALICTCVVFVAACADALSPGHSVTISQSGTTASLVVYVDGGSCTGKVVNVRVSIDGTLAGTIQPGGVQTARWVSLGNHTVAGNGDRVGGGTAVVWSPLTVNVSDMGVLQPLTCTNF